MWLLLTLNGYLDVDLVELALARIGSDVRGKIREMVDQLLHCVKGEEM